MSVSLLIRPAPDESGDADNSIAPIVRKCLCSFKGIMFVGWSSARNQNSAGVMSVMDVASRRDIIFPLRSRRCEEEPLTVRPIFQNLGK
jgi:hypothetical protein